MPNKVRILAFSDKELHSKGDVYTLQVNPETYKHGHRTVFTRAQGSNTAGTIQKFHTMLPQDLSFEFVLDATGMIAGVDDLADEIQRFRDVTYTYHGSIHSPYCLQILWGRLAFKCALASLNIDYLLLTPADKPLRARLAVAFREHATPFCPVHKADKKSADRTHAETVTDGATQPLIVNRVYDRPDLYINVARAKDLSDIMHLTAGDRLRCPHVKES